MQRGLRAMGGAVAIAVVIGVLGVAPVGAATTVPVTTTPTVKVTTYKTYFLKVQWTFKKAPKNVTGVQVQRSVDAFASVAETYTAPNPKAKGKVYDAPTPPGTYWYRARVMVGTSWEPWSVPVAASGGAPPPAACGTEFTDEVLRLVNYERLSRGLNPLVNDTTLRNNAQAHSQWMSEHNSMTHGGAGPLRAQNISWNQATPAIVMQGWMHSSGHKANILGPYSRIGVGCYHDVATGWWWTQNFT